MTSLYAFLREEKQHPTFAAWGKLSIRQYSSCLSCAEVCSVALPSVWLTALLHRSPCLEKGWIPNRYPGLLPSSLCWRSEADIWHWYLTALPLEGSLEFTPQNKKISYLFPTGWNIFFFFFSLRLGGYILMHLQTKWNEMDWSQYNTACSAVVRITKEKLPCCVLLKPHHWHQLLLFLININVQNIV